MTLRIFSIQHHRQGLAEVERIAARLAALPGTPRPEGVLGSVLLSTCNRVEVILDTDGDTPDSALRAALNAAFDVAPAWDLFLGEAALEHLFLVAAGLDSMVVGECEIAGQLRRALAAAQAAGTASLPLTIAIGEALKTSRRVANQTGLEGVGRSVVAAGLDLVALPWRSTRALIVGTGSYAGAVVAALRSRGVVDIAVHSASGRGEEFADGHATAHAPDLRDGLESADLVVTCRGLGAHAVVASDVTRPATFLDLSLKRDVDPAVGRLPGSRLVDLAAIQDAVGAGIEHDTRQARAIVDAGVAEGLTRLRARIVDPAVVGLRESVLALVADEVARLPERALSREDAALALRRLATRLLHVPSSRARTAAEQGRTEQYLSAMAELYGIGEAAEAPAGRLEEQQCPVTNLRVCDLESSEVRAAV